MPSRNESLELLRQWLPDGAVERVCDYLVERNATLRIARHRSSKLGDYRPPQRGVPRHAISVGGDLGKGLFLWVLLHEMAHLENHLHHPTAEPHGHEWQTEYARLIVDYADCFDPSLLPLIKAYVGRIPLRRSVGAEIERRLREVDSGTKLLTVADLEPGALFALSGRGNDVYRLESRRRTRWLCTHLATGRQYLVAGTAQIRRAEV